MKKALLVSISVIVLIVAAILGAGIYFINTPEYALMRIMQDVDRAGMDGLQSHLTEHAKETVAIVEEVAESDLVSAVMGLIDKKGYAGILKSEIQEICWEVSDILKSKDKAEVILAFNYKDKIKGTIGISMIREERQWKIDGIEFPQFDEISW